jgi:CO dehydrogenase maturation factor
LSPEQLLGSVDFGEAVVVADLEAGIGTLLRMSDSTIDVVLAIVEPTPRSIEVGQRAVELARQRLVGRIIVVASRVTEAADLDRVTAAFPGCEVVAVPYDEDVVDAERGGVAPLDVAPDAPAVRALIALATSLA